MNVALREMLARFVRRTSAHFAASLRVTRLDFSQ